MANKGGKGATGRRSTSWRSILLGGRAINTTNRFGVRNERYSAGYHTGVDFGAARGTPINIPLRGTVVSRGSGGAYGNTLLIRLADGHYMRLAHMDTIPGYIQRGYKLASGEFVGEVGSTGYSTGPHLHLEIMTPKSGGVYSSTAFIDPVAYLSSKKIVPAAGVGQRHRGADSNVPQSGADPRASGKSGAGGRTYDTGDGGWDKMAVEGFTRKDFYAALESMYGDIDTLLRLDRQHNSYGGKSIRWAINEMVRKKIVDERLVVSILNKTGWFKKHSAESTKRLIAEKDRPGVFKEEMRQKRSYIKSALDQLGVKLSAEDLERIARNAYIYDWSDSFIMDKVQRAKGIRFRGGAIAEAEDEMITYADDYGVAFTDADLRQVRSEMMDGAGLQTVRDAIQERAARRYAIWADQILNGQSVRSLASSYFEQAAQMLEVDPNTIEWDDPLFKGGRAFTTTDADGKQAQKGLWEFEKDIRQDARWMDTKNARDEVMGKAAGLLSTMGLI